MRMKWSVKWVGFITENQMKTSSYQDIDCGCETHMTAWGILEDSKFTEPHTTWDMRTREWRQQHDRKIIEFFCVYYA